MITITMVNDIINVAATVTRECNSNHYYNIPVGYPLSIISNVQTQLFYSMRRISNKRTRRSMLQQSFTDLSF